MSSSFNKYYYDQFTKKTLIRDEWSEDDTKTKLQIASESVVALLDHLDEDDQFGMVLFDDKAYLMKKNHFRKRNRYGRTQKRDTGYFPRWWNKS